MSHSSAPACYTLCYDEGDLSQVSVTELSINNVYKPTTHNHTFLDFSKFSIYSLSSKICYILAFATSVVSQQLGGIELSTISRVGYSPGRLEESSNEGLKSHRKY